MSISSRILAEIDQDETMNKNEKDFLLEILSLEDRGAWRYQDDYNDALDTLIEKEKNK